jgi:hypothetical protein
VEVDVEALSIGPTTNCGKKDTKCKKKGYKFLVVLFSPVNINCVCGKCKTNPGKDDL